MSRSPPPDATTPITAIAISPAMRATALFTPDAMPASPGPASLSTVVVSGATVSESPTENPSSAGQEILRVRRRPPAAARAGACDTPAISGPAVMNQRGPQRAENFPA